ncbi:microtubule-associated protein Jupiter-like isoform X2 [Dinothrombium tinctorium]|uniref:Microtubule-associated protein Jupiter-like isoform X2 n=1 Tax=Dinothrombium tinctorium TaxID=1965070 RepID=A0A443QPA6_9ACAR|nr:microtubule-associated protein Jupiter-like isoform X2 [Dinothrombium tinctorium]
MFPDSGSSESRSEASTPVNSINGNCSPPMSPSMRVRSARNEDTKTRLFGPPESSPRKIRNHLKSTVFSTETCEAPKVSPKKYGWCAVRRNPITGEIYDDIFSGGNEKINGNATAGSLSLPSTPVKIRQPPGGKSSAIFY